MHRGGKIGTIRVTFDSGAFTRSIADAVVFVMYFSVAIFLIDRMAFLIVYTPGKSIINNSMEIFFHRFFKAKRRFFASVPISLGFFRLIVSFEEISIWKWIQLWASSILWVLLAVLKVKMIGFVCCNMRSRIAGKFMSWGGGGRFKVFRCPFRRQLSSGCVVGI